MGTLVNNVVQNIVQLQPASICVHSFRDGLLNFSMLTYQKP